MTEAKQPEQEFEQFEQNEKILTPGQIVMKRFMRNKLAVTGIVILVVLTLFCFFGPIFRHTGNTNCFIQIQ